MLLITGFLGGEAVYRHGLGVMSLPTVGADGHHHGINSPPDNSSAQQHDEMTTESEPHHHLNQKIEPNMDMNSNTKMDEHSYNAEEEATTPHEHQH